MTKYQRLLNSNEALRRRETVLRAEIERLKTEGAACRRAREGLAEHYHETKAEIARLRSSAALVLRYVEVLHDDVDAGQAWQRRQRGGQQVGHSSSSFCTTPPGGIVAIRRAIQWIREALA